MRFARVPHEVTAAREMSDAAFRAWVALKRWTEDDRFPTNGQLAEACGWFNDKGEPASWKAKRALRELESLGKARRITATDENGLYRRIGIEVNEPPPKR